MKRPIFDLEDLKARIAASTLPFQPSLKKRNQLVRIWGDNYMPFIRTICARLQPNDFSHNWKSPNCEDYCADVYGIQADITGDNCNDDAYAFYIKLGVAPGQTRDSSKLMLSFHPTDEITLASGLPLRTTIEGWNEDD